MFEDYHISAGKDGFELAGQSGSKILLHHYKNIAQKLFCY